MKKLVVEVARLTGQCDAGLREGDRFEVTEDFRLSGDKCCYFAMSSLVPVLMALQAGLEPSVLGLSHEQGVAYLQCSDPGHPWTSGGTVVFRVSALKGA